MVTGRPANPKMIKAVGDLRRSGKTVSEVSEIFNIPPKQVVYWSGKAGIADDKKAVSKAFADKVIELAESGMARADIARAMNTNPPRITKILAKAKIETTRLNSGLTESQKEIIKNNHFSNKRYRKSNAILAKELGVSEGKVCTARTQMGLRYSKEELRKYYWKDLEDAASSVGMKIVSQEFSFSTTDWIEAICHCGRLTEHLSQSFLNGSIESCGCADSKSEVAVLDFVRTLTKEPVEHNKTGLFKKSREELDIWIPSKKIGIEMCGIKWHGELQNGTEAIQKHYKKYKECKDQGIRLLTVWENEWYLRNLAVTSYIKSIFGVFDNVVGARECNIVDIGREAAESFLELHHIQGRCSSAKFYGLEHKGIVVAIIGVKKVKREPDAMSIERYCVCSGWAVRGGFEKLMSHTQKKFPKINKLYTFSDNRWSYGNIYIKTGFSQIGKVLRPSYWYAKSGSKTPVLHKSLFRKGKIKGILPDETEWEAMKRLKYDRVWDCGKIKWVKHLQTKSP